MKIYKQSILLVFLTIFFSCKSQEKSHQKNNFDDELKKCVNQSLNVEFHKIDPNMGLDFYKMMFQMERYLIDEGYLKPTVSIEDYTKLIDRIIDDKKIIGAIKNGFEEIKNNNNHRGTSISNIVLQSCPHLIVAKDKKHETSLYKQVEVLDKMYALDPYNLDYLIEMINSVSRKDFSNLTFRSPAIVILLDYMDYVNKDTDQLNKIASSLKLALVKARPLES